MEKGSVEKSSFKEQEFPILTMCAMLVGLLVELPNLIFNLITATLLETILWRGYAFTCLEKKHDHHVIWKFYHPTQPSSWYIMVLQNNLIWKKLNWKSGCYESMVNMGADRKIVHSAPCFFFQILLYKKKLTIIPHHNLWDYIVFKDICLSRMKH